MRPSQEMAVGKSEPKTPECTGWNDMRAPLNEGGIP
jgi:hypothetical protein